MTDSEQLIRERDVAMLARERADEALVYLEKEVAGYKAQVAGQAHYIKCLLDEVRELKERIAEFVKGA